MTVKHYDIVIVGTGAGGGTLAYALKDSGMNILLVERGDFLPQEAENWDVAEVWTKLRYYPQEKWHDAKGKEFRPMQHYFVGGNTKVYGAALPRFRQEDFIALEHQGGLSPAWPITYHDLEPYYQQAEEIYLVHGAEDGDSTAPPRSHPFPFPAIPHEPYTQGLLARFKQQGLSPSSLPIGIDLREGGRCIFCSTCENHPCQVLAKGDADACCVRPALESPHVEILTRAYARRLLTDSSGERVVGVEVERDGEILQISGDKFVVSCGAINSAALLLRSANDKHPHGLANSSGLVGRNFMGHNVTFFIAFHCKRANDSVFQKTWQINNFYFKSPDFPYPMGNIQASGKWPIYAILPTPLHQPLRQLTESRYLVLATTSEDLPAPNNRVTLTREGKIQIHYQANNVLAHQRLNKLVHHLLRQVGYFPVLTYGKVYNTDKIAHQCGTLRFGLDPTTSVLDPFCRTHDLENLYCVDASFFPSSTATNPTLTIVAQALRVGDHLSTQSVASPKTLLGQPQGDLPLTAPSSPQSRNSP